MSLRYQRVLKVDPIYWDSKILRYKHTNKVPKEVRVVQQHVEGNDSACGTNVDKDVTRPVLTAIIDDFLHPDRKSKENTGG